MFGPQKCFGCSSLSHLFCLASPESRYVFGQLHSYLLLDSNCHRALLVIQPCLPSLPGYLHLLGKGTSASLKPNMSVTLIFGFHLHLSYLKVESSSSLLLHCQAAMSSYHLSSTPSKSNHHFCALSGKMQFITHCWSNYRITPNLPLNQHTSYSLYSVESTERCIKICKPWYVICRQFNISPGDCSRCSRSWKVPSST